MNDNYREYKVRLRRLYDILGREGPINLEFAQALSRAHRAERHGDRSREPSMELRTLLERAESLAPRQMA
jgi:hypothetical protein